MKTLNKVLQQRSFFFFLFTFVAGCTKEASVPQSQAQDPLFVVVGKAGDDSLKLYAGKNEYYLKTSYRKGDSGIFVFSGEFIKQNCLVCNTDFKIEIYDEAPRPAEVVTNIDKVLKPGSFKYTDSIPIISYSHDVQFTTESQNIWVLWEFGDGDTTAQTNPVHNFKKAGSYNVCLTVYDGVHFTKTCNNIIIEDKKQCNIQYTQEFTGLTGLFNATPGHQQYIWYFGDSTAVETTGAPKISHTFSKKGIYTIELSSSDSNGCALSFSKTISINTKDTTVSSYTYTYNSTGSVSFSKRSKVRITWTSDKGSHYSSHKFTGTGAQPSSSYFTITESAPYKKDAANHSTYKISAKVQAMLYNINTPGDSILFKTDKLVFGVAYPD